MILFSVNRVVDSMMYIQPSLIGHSPGGRHHDFNNGFEEFRFRQASRSLNCELEEKLLRRW